MAGATLSSVASGGMLVKSWASYNRILRTDFNAIYNYGLARDGVNQGQRGEKKSMQLGHSF